MRLDNFLVEKGYFDSRTKAKQAIERGEIYLNSKKITKCSYLVNSDVDAQHICQNNFVSIGGYKLKKALDDFNLCVKDMVAADIGASTGGFTDCLINSGAKKVYAVDLNDELLHHKLKSDSRVVRVIKNARELMPSDFNDAIDLIVADLSFISLSYVLSVFSNLMQDSSKLIVLIKPQFEAGERRKFKNGIIKDKKIQLKVCENVYQQALKCGLFPIGFTTAPIEKEKNVEFLMLFDKQNAGKLDISCLNY